jgi:hypothetical protein
MAMLSCVGTERRAGTLASTSNFQKSSWVCTTLPRYEGTGNDFCEGNAIQYTRRKVSRHVADMSPAVAVKFMNMLLSNGFCSPHTLCGDCAVLVSVGFVQAERV